MGQEDFMAGTKMLFQALKKRRYKRSFLRPDKKTSQKREEETNSIPLILTYLQLSGATNNKLKHGFQDLVQNKNLLEGHSNIRRNQNLRDQRT
ncbi:hypothetical protein GN956_G16956 [Arapaima gigas]